jgi:hypothetical protein
VALGKVLHKLPTDLLGSVNQVADLRCDGYPGADCHMPHAREAEQFAALPSYVPGLLAAVEFSQSGKGTALPPFPP